MSFLQLQNLSPSEAQAGRPVQLKAIALCYDPGWNEFYVHDGNGTYYVNPQKFRTQPTAALELGQWIEINGTTAFIDGNTTLTNISVTVLERGTIPAAKRLRLFDLGSDFGQWIETDGFVRTTDISTGRLMLTLRDKDGTCGAYLMGQVATNHHRDLLDCKVRIRGINASTVVNGKLDSALVYVPQLSEIVILEKPAARYESSPVVSIGSLLDRELGAWTNNRVHINGLVSAHRPGQSMVVKDPTGVIRAQAIQKTPVEEGARVDVQGFLTITTNGVFLRDVFFEVAASPSSEFRVESSTAPLSPGQAANIPKLITNIAGILKLRRAESAQRIPVRVRGVVTYADPEWRNGFLQDEQGAVYFDLSQKDIRSGQWIELAGVTSPGGFAPEVLDTSIQVLGTTNLPVPAKVRLVDLANGRLDAHWIEVEGVVRQVRNEWEHLVLNVMTSQGSIKVIVLSPANEPPPVHLIDALVSIPGACTSELNARRQLTGMLLNVPRLDMIRVIEPAPQDPFSIPATPIEEVATFDPDRLAGRRVKVNGVVTLPIPGQGFILQNAAGGIRIHTQQTNEVQTGDSMDVVGFPAMGEFSPILEDAHFRKTGNHPIPIPLKTTADQVLQYGTNDCLLVQLEARLVQGIRHAANPQLVLQEGSIVFSARVENPIQGQEIPNLRSGSLVRITGVCLVQGDPQHKPTAFRLLLRQPADIELLETPAWWTLRHALILAGTLTAIILVALAWIALLRRQVRTQTEVIRQKLEHEAALETRYRELFENANDLLFTLDLKGRCTSVNRAVEHFFGLNRQQALEKHIAEFVAPENQPQIHEQLKLLLTGDSSNLFEVNAARGNKQTAVLDFRLRMIRENGCGKGIQATVRDVTELKNAQAELLRTSRLVGMAEVATGILHNVGNALNSVNVSTTVVNDRLRQTRIPELAKATAMLRDHEADLPAFLTRDPKGKLLPSYLILVAEHLAQEQSILLTELATLIKNVAHIKEIVTMQQSYAKVVGVVESVRPADLIEDAIEMCAAAFSRHRIELVREYEETPPISIDRHKILQIMLNLLNNAKHAMAASAANSEKRLVVGIARNGPDRIRLSVKDNGIGISTDNMARIFRHGFTTKKDGHGFGLHFGALTAKEMGGSLTAHSDGVGRGALFVLELPLAVDNAYSKVNSCEDVAAAR